MLAELDASPPAPSFSAFNFPTNKHRGKVDMLVIFMIAAKISLYFSTPAPFCNAILMLPSLHNYSVVLLHD